jgi:hypothetical protein
MSSPSRQVPVLVSTPIRIAPGPRPALIEKGCRNRCKIAGFSCKILAYSPRNPLAYFRAPASRVAVGVSAGGSYRSLVRQGFRCLVPWFLRNNRLPQWGTLN